MADSEQKVCTFTFKKRGKSRQTRKRQASDSDGSNDEESAVKKRERKNAGSGLVQKTAKLKAKDESVAYSSSDEEATGSVTHSYRSSNTAQREGPSDGGATATYNIDTDFTKDAQAIFERAQKVNEELKDKEDDKIYRGMNNYAVYIAKRDTAAGNAASGHVRKGPIRAPTNIRSTVRWDYQPDICKDYKETGFCGFGDSCKFMHDRSDYKHGWQLEREVEAGEYGDTEDMSKYEISSDEEDLPFKCFLCRNSFKNPVVTKCKHYFCESCALKHYKKSKRCYVCNQQTMGVFNPAKDVIAKMKKHAEENAGKEDVPDEDNSD